MVEVEAFFDEEVASTKAVVVTAVAVMGRWLLSRAVIIVKRSCEELPSWTCEVVEEICRV